MEDSHQLGLFFVVVLGFATFSKRLTRRWITAPIFFVLLGLVLGSAGLDWLRFEPEDALVETLTEGTLMLLLFSDASQIRLTSLRHRWALPGRLLGIGMPLTILAGAGVGALIFPQWPVIEALLVATVLAPTDAALGQAVVSNEAVPEPVREALTVESGLNDGIALPLVLVLLALAMSQVDSGSEWLWFWGAQVLLGPLAGVLVGGLSGSLLDWGHRRGWSEPSSVPAGSIAIVLLCYLTAEAIGGNGFMAAFIGGMVFGATATNVRHQVHEFLESEGQLLLWMVFTLLGCVFAGPALEAATPGHLIYAVLSLTVVRMVPVALSMVGTGHRTPTVLFIGWFGPRGLASLLFGFLLLEESGLRAGAELFDVILLTVLLSVALHGVSAATAAVRYGAWAESERRIEP